MLYHRFIKTKYYFLNSELTKLINEPNDGLADVNSINDLRISKTFWINKCNDFERNSSQLLNPSNTGQYDSQGGFIEFEVSTIRSGYYFHGGSTSLTSYIWSVDICPGGDAYFYKINLGDGYSYHWQVDSGDGFGNIVTDNIYNVIDDNLVLQNPPTSFYGYKFRCIASNLKTGNNIILPVKELKFVLYWSGTVNADWGNPDNWQQCSIFNLGSTTYAIPDKNTDVIIGYYYPGLNLIVKEAVQCRSMELYGGAEVQVLIGGNVLITGK